MTCFQQPQMLELADGHYSSALPFQQMPSASLGEISMPFAFRIEQ
jgi:hypothetical protein